MVFVGAYFFLKGGLETLRATEVLLRKGHPLHLHIVSTMLYGDHASKTTKADLQEALKIIARHPKFIHHHDSLRNAAVLDLFRSADIGLLPTWADTYGYSALEAMAAGCPVISTDIRALPEFNDGTTGWPIQMPKDDWGYARIVTGEQRRAFSIQLQESLISIFEQILANPQEIHEKALSAYDRIVGRHSPEKAAAVLENWYDEAMDPGR
jgi:glycosyltransferase involved in cell wall biosynthesis